MEDALRALRVENNEIVLPSMRAPERELGRITISIAWDATRRRYAVVSTPDHGGDQTERLLASERREKLLLQQQTDAARARLAWEQAQSPMQAQGQAWQAQTPGELPLRRSRAPVHDSTSTDGPRTSG